jgi:hypothetical protein
MYHRIYFWQGVGKQQNLALAAISNWRCYFKSEKNCPATRLMRVRIVVVGPDAGFALHDLVSISIAFRVEEFQLVGGGLSAGARTVHHPGVECRDAPPST